MNYNVVELPANTKRDITSVGVHLQVTQSVTTSADPWFRSTAESCALPEWGKLGACLMIGVDHREQVSGKCKTSDSLVTDEQSLLGHFCEG